MRLVAGPSRISVACFELTIESSAAIRFKMQSKDDGEYSMKSISRIFYIHTSLFAVALALIGVVAPSILYAPEQK
jgi:hypothetical protein